MSGAYYTLGIILGVVHVLTKKIILYNFWYFLCNTAVIFNQDEMPLCIQIFNLLFHLKYV